MDGVVSNVGLPDLLAAIGELEVQRRLLVSRVGELEAENAALRDRVAESEEQT